MQGVNMQLIRTIFVAASILLSTSNIYALPSLEEYLDSKGVQVLEGHMAGGQKEQFNQALKNYPWIKTVAEIGLNAGHSAENFFNNCKELELFVSFDIKSWSYVNVAIEYLSSKYGSRFFFLEGDSAKMVPWFSTNHSHIKFDLIYIDGNHSYLGCLRDIRNCKSIAKPGSILWIDDYESPEVKRAIEICVNKKIIVIDKIHTEDWHWVEAHYTF